MLHRGHGARGFVASLLLVAGGASACNVITGVDQLDVSNGGASAGGSSTTSGQGAGNGNGGASHGSSSSGGTSGNASSGGTSGNASSGGASSGGASSGGTSSGGTSSGGTSSGGTSSGGTTSTSSSSSTSSGATGEPPAEVGMTAAHNAARAAVMPAANPALPAMSWSSSIAAVAQAFTNNCVFADDTSSGYGSNAFAGTGTYTPADVVQAWVSEDAYYNYATNTCAAGKECGHYTQVVWRDSVQLGCGMTHCNKNNPFTSNGSGAWVLWVCEYNPPGNYVGMKPY